MINCIYGLKQTLCGEDLGLFNRIVKLFDEGRLDRANGLIKLISNEALASVIEIFTRMDEQQHGYWATTNFIHGNIHSVPLRNNMLFLLSGISKNSSPRPKDDEFLSPSLSRNPRFLEMDGNWDESFFDEVKEAVMNGFLDYVQDLIEGIKNPRIREEAEKLYEEAKKLQRIKSEQL